MTTRVRIDAPCPASWEAMDGSVSRRFCGQCRKHVHDLSSMTEEEGREVLAQPSACVRFRVGPGGEVLFAAAAAALLASAPALAAADHGVPEDSKGKKVEAKVKKKDRPRRLTLQILDQLGNPVPTAFVRVVQAKDRAPVKTDGSWSSDRVFLPDGTERVFTKGTQVELEIGAPGYQNRRVVVEVKKKDRSVAVALDPLNPEPSGEMFMGDVGSGRGAILMGGI